jgi:predicted alpha/beta hydrolase family esterase
MNMTPRFIFIHGNDTRHWSFGWASWLKAELENLGFETFFETMPDSIIARSKYWLPFLKDYVKAGSNDVLIGMSTGAVAAMRYAESNQILGSVLISPSYTDLDDEFEKQGGYFDEPWNWDNIKSHQNKIALVWGDDDPYIPTRPEAARGFLSHQSFQALRRPKFGLRTETPANKNDTDASLCHFYCLRSWVMRPEILQSKRS